MVALLKFWIVCSAVVRACVNASRMRLQMEDPAFTCIKALIDSITLYLTGNVNKTATVVKVNNDNLLKNGELYFLLSLKPWKSVYRFGDICDGNCTTVLRHFLHMHNRNSDDKADTDVAEQVLQELVLASKNWAINIEKCFLERERVCLFLNKLPIIRGIIKQVLTDGSSFGSCPAKPERIFHLKISEDSESDLTTTRLHLLLSATENILKLHGCAILNDVKSFKIIFTTKSEGKVEENYKKYICGVVRNSKSNIKDVSLSWEQHISEKMKELEEINEHKLFEMQDQKCDTHAFLKHIASATAIFELLAVKPSRPVLIGHNFTSDKNVTNTKGAAFVLYNIARISTIISKYNEKKAQGEYPELPSIDDIDFSYLEQEDEWDLIYNFIVAYPSMLQDCAKYDSGFQTSPQVICIFLSRLCQKFSIYYRKTRILTVGYDHLLPAMFARLYMIQALHTVLQNALEIFNIQPVSHM